MIDREISVRLSALLKAHGLKSTVQRDAVAGVMLSGRCHKTAQELHAQLKPGYPALSLNTVYLTLQQFESLGLLKRVQIGARCFFDSNVDPHDHAYCQRCGLLLDVQLGHGQQPPLTLGQWRIEGASHTWFGLCPACAAVKKRS